MDFFDDLKSRTGVCLHYQFLEYRPEALQKLEILVNGEPVDALAAIVHEKEAFHKGQRLITKLRRLSRASCSTWPSRPLGAERA